MTKINLLFVITKLELGGAQKQALSVLRHLDREKYNLFLFTAYQGPNYSEALGLPGLKIKRSLFLERPVNLLFDFLALIELIIFIKKNKINLLHTHSSKAGILGRFAAKISRVDVVLHTVHGWSFNDFQPPFLRSLYVWLEKICAAFSDKIIVVSEHDRHKGLTSGIGREDQYRLIRYGIDHSEFLDQDGSFRKEFGISPQEQVVGMVSCFKPQKAPQDFIKLAVLVSRKISGVKFVLVGDGILRRSVEKLVNFNNLQDRVILTGWRKDIPSVLSGFDVFVLTSLWEGLPIAALEAMASSLPVIATSTGGITELLAEGKTGFLVPPHDVVAMSEKVSLLLGDRDLRSKIGEKAQEALSAEFTTTGMVGQFQRLYSELLQSGKGSHVN